MRRKRFIFEIIIIYGNVSSEVHMDIVAPGIYRHFKGSLYFVAGLAQHSETSEDFVVYYPLYPSEVKMFVRPLAMWNEQIERDGYSGQRFVKILDWNKPNIIPGHPVKRNQNIIGVGDYIYRLFDLSTPASIRVEVRNGDWGEILKFGDFLNFYKL